MLAAVLIAAASAGVEPGAAAGAKCSGALPQGPGGLSSALVVTTACGRFGVEPGGNVVRQGPWTSPVPAVAEAYWMDLAWYGRSYGHLLIGQGMKQLWRSHYTYPGRRRGDVGDIVLGRQKLAFSFFRGRRSALYRAPFGGRARLVADGEMPLAFTASGAIVTWRLRGGALALRRGDGRLTRRLSAHAVDPQSNPQRAVVVFRSVGRLLVFDGARVRTLASLGRLGITGPPIVEPLGGLIAVHDLKRLVVLRYDGSVFASTALPIRPKRLDSVSSSVVANADGTAVAYTVTRFGAPGYETVYLLSADAQRAEPLFTQELYFNQCERGAWLAWQGRWLLYADTEQRAAVVDSSGEGAPDRTRRPDRAAPRLLAGGRRHLRHRLGVAQRFQSGQQASLRRKTRWPSTPTIAMWTP
jgi:hypothetical protein